MLSDVEASRRRALVPLRWRIMRRCVVHRITQRTDGDCLASTLVPAYGCRSVALSLLDVSFPLSLQIAGRWFPVEEMSPCFLARCKSFPVPRLFCLLLLPQRMPDCLFCPQDSPVDPVRKELLARSRPRVSQEETEKNQATKYLLPGAISLNLRGWKLTADFSCHPSL